MHIRAPTDSQTALAPSHGIASSQTGTVVAKLLPAQIELLPKVVESQPRSSQVEVDASTEISIDGFGEGVARCVVGLGVSATIPGLGNRVWITTGGASLRAELGETDGTEVAATTAGDGASVDVIVGAEVDVAPTTSAQHLKL